MQIWVDADACPVVIKNILYRAANRTRTQLILVSNQILQTPFSPYIKKIRVGHGFDVADNEIIRQMQEGDLVVTADIPLADAVISKQGQALNPRGILYSPDNIKQRLAMRDFNEQLRDGGLITGGPSKISQKEVQNFANCLDRLLIDR